MPLIRPDVVLIILFNCIPVIGVAYYDWAPFEMFWLFWMETLIISVFNTIRVLYSQGGNAAGLDERTPLQLNLRAALIYLVLRIVIFLFYSLFIIVFIGFLGSSDEQTLRSMQSVALVNPFFNLALLMCFCSQAYYLIRYFFMNNYFYSSKPSQYAAVFDGRQVVIHIAIVAGAIGTSFLFKNDEDQTNGAIWTISTFCLLKCLFELYINRSGEQAVPQQ